MTTWASRAPFRRLTAVLPLAGALMLAVASLPAGATQGGFTDADDVPLALDLKAMSHTNDERRVTYTVETWQSFPDQQANFRWALVRSGAAAPGLFVSVRWVGGLVAAVTDGTGKPVAEATAGRPAPNALRVSFPTSALGESGAYGYHVTAVTDLDGDGVGGAGEVDEAPDSGSYKHGLSLGRGLGSGPQLVDGPTPRSVASPAASPPIPVAPAPAPVAPIAPAPAVAPAPTGPPTPLSTPASVLDAALKSASSTPASQTPAAGSQPAPAQTHEAVPTLPRTGPGATAGLLAGFLLCLGGFCVAVGRPGAR
jgi:hypothetical protein